MFTKEELKLLHYSVDYLLDDIDYWHNNVALLALRDKLEELKQCS